MKKIVTMIIVFILTLHLTSVSAETFSNYLPGGKNYLNPENFTVNSDTLYTLENIRVKANQAYTLSFPNRDMLGENISVLLEGEDVYIDEFPIDTQCSSDSDYVSCTFITSIEEESISIMIQSELIGLYYSYYEIDFFQLEEGNVNTDYEAYIDPYIDSASPEFSGTGGYITSYQSATNLSEIIGSSIVAYDAIDGDLTDQIVVLSDQYTGNELIVGEYLVELSVSDNAGNVATFSLYIFVKDEIVPVITAPDNIYLNVNDAFPLTSVVSSYITYTDEYDESPIYFFSVDEYSSNEATIGSYNVTIEVSDVFGNSTSKSIILHVEDNDPPVLNSTSIFDVDVTPGIALAEILSSMDVTDNYDENVAVDVVSDSYSGNESTIGTYFVDIMLHDTSSNTSQVTLTIHVTDNSNPIISGPSEISTSYTEILSLEDIKQMLSIEDNYDLLNYNDIEIVDDNYSSNADTPGEYYIEFEVFDGSGNIGTYELKIIVIDDVSPIIYIDQYIVVVEVGSSFGVSDMMKLLRLSNEINNEEYEITVLQDEYKGNEKNPGDYIYKVRLEDFEGNEIIREFKITVPEDYKIDYTTPIVYTLIGTAILTGALFYRKYR